MTNTTDEIDLRMWAIIIWSLYLASYVTFALTAVAAVIIAYIKRSDLSGTPFESHATSAIRTFWISLIGGLIGLLTSFVGIGIVILIVLAIWNLFRVIRGLVRALDGKPIDDPTGWL